MVVATDNSAPVTARLSGALAEVLRQERGRCNALFAQARLTQPELDPAAFGEHLCRVVAPAVDAVFNEAPERTHAVAVALYELSLQLFQLRLAGATTHCPLIVEAWGLLLPRLPRLLAAEPVRVASSLTHALNRLTEMRGPRPREWLRLMTAVAPHAAELATWLQAGQIAAWRAGAAHYRRAALQLARELLPAAPAAVAAALGQSPDLDTASLNTLLQRLAADPWLHPDNAQPPPAAPQLRLAATAGAFRGFGGPFETPPIVQLVNDQFLAADRSRSWVISADACGVTFLPAGLAPLSITRQLAPGPRFSLTAATGTVGCGELHTPFPELAAPTSAAGDAHSLALTIPLSHAVFFITA